jgi:hypothetical protein
VYTIDLGVILHVACREAKRRQPAPHHASCAARIDQRDGVQLSPEPAHLHAGCGVLNLVIDCINRVHLHAAVIANTIMHRFATFRIYFALRERELLYVEMFRIFILAVFVLDKHLKY